MTGDFHVLPTPKLKQAAKDCPLLERNAEAWIACCSRRFSPLAKRIAGDDDLAEEVLQISWLKVLQGINHACFDGPKACPWVHRVVTNTARDAAEQRRRRREEPLQERRSPDTGPEDLAQEREMLVLLGEIIQLLPDTYRQILEIRLYEGLSNQETSQRLHISRSSVSTRLNRAVNLLKRHLDARAHPTRDLRS